MGGFSAEVREEYLSDVQRAFEQRAEVGERALRRDAEREASRKERERQLAAERAQREADQKVCEGGTFLAPSWNLPGSFPEGGMYV